MRPLDGVIVVSLEQAVAAPFATRQLADLGARVIKVERPGVGDFARSYDESVHGLSSYFVWLNRSKESLTLDLKSTRAKEILTRLLSVADVFVHNLAPGAVGRLGFGADVLRSTLPRLINCTISGYGPTGPWASRKAYDLIVQSETGLVSVTGTPECAAKVGISIGDIAAGMYAYSGILSALLQREASGRISSVDVSLFDALAEWMGSPMYYTRYAGTAPARTGLAHATIAPYGPYGTNDDAVVLAVQSPREWETFCDRVLGAAELAEDARFVRNSARVAHRVELDQLIAARFADLSSATVLELLDAAGIANARLNTVEQFLAHPVLNEPERWVAVDTEGGPIEALLPPAVLSGIPTRMGPVPSLGEHTDVILRHIGYTDEQVAQLRSDGVL
jgi:formyl-CoA transferase